MPEAGLARPLLAALLVGVLQTGPVWLAAAGAAEAAARPTPSPLLLGGLFAAAWVAGLVFRPVDRDRGARRLLPGALGVLLALAIVGEHRGASLLAGPGPLAAGLAHDPAGPLLLAGCLYLWWHGLRAVSLRPYRDEAASSVLLAGLALALALVLFPGTAVVRSAGPAVLLVSFAAAVALLFLSQVERIGSAALDWRGWAVILFGLALGVVLAALLLSALLGGRVGELIVLVLQPIAVLLRFLLLLLVLVGAFLIALLDAVLSGLIGSLERPRRTPLFDLAAWLDALAAETRRELLPAELFQALGWLLAGLALLGVAALLARALQRPAREESGAPDERESLLSAAVAAASLRQAITEALDPIRRLLAARRDGDDWRSVVRRTYRELLAAMVAAGWRWRADGTPIEFLPELEARVPGSAADLRLITEAYLLARYAGPEAEALDPAPVRAAWRRLRADLARPQGN